MATTSSLDRLTLDLPPSCIVFCPTQPQLFVVGTYYLHVHEQQGSPSSTEFPEETQPQSSKSRPATQHRTGSLTLFRLEPEATITLLQTLETDSAILDLQWTPHTALLGDVLAAATSTGQLRFYHLNSGTTAVLPHLQPTSTAQIADAATLVLALDWHPTRPRVLGCSLSDGRVRLCSCSDNIRTPWSAAKPAVSIRNVYRHSLEAWTLAFAPDGLSVYSGGDDAVVQCSSCTDVEADAENARGDDLVDEADAQDDEELSTPPLWTDHARAHGAGIPALLPLSDSLLVTGSYDDHIRLLSGPHGAGRGKVLAELNLGGGVWRVKVLETTPRGDVSATTAVEAAAALRPSQDQDPGDASAAAQDARRTRSYTLLVSCMHAGVRVVRLTYQPQVQVHQLCAALGRTPSEDPGSGEGTWQFAVLASFEEHESMNYGSDVQPSSDASSDGVLEVIGGVSRARAIVSTSFYDKLLCVWRVEMGES